MPRYVETFETTLPAADTFAYLAELSNFAHWDPGVQRSERVVGDAPSLGSEYDVTVNGAGKPMILRYRIVAFDPPRRLVIDAETRILRSIDTVLVRSQADGATVRYVATLRLKGPLRIANGLLAIAFRRIAARAGSGLKAAFAQLEP